MPTFTIELKLSLSEEELQWQELRRLKHSSIVVRVIGLCSKKGDFYRLLQPKLKAEVLPIKDVQLLGRNFYQIESQQEENSARNGSHYDDKLVMQWCPKIPNTLPADRMELDIVEVQPKISLDQDFVLSKSSNGLQMVKIGGNSQDGSGRKLND